MTKTKGNALIILLSLLAVILTVAMSATAYFFLKNRPIVEENIAKNEDIVSDEGAKKIPVEDEKQKEGQIVPVIKELDIKYQCADGQLKDIQMETQKAYLVYEVKDLPQYKLDEINRDFPEIGTNKFLVIQSKARNSTSTTGADSSKTVYSSYYFRLTREASDYRPVIYGGPTLAPFTNGTVYTMFPVRSDETSFAISYCNLAEPTTFTLDFSSDGAQVVRGVFSIEKGFVQSF